MNWSGRNVEKIPVIGELVTEPIILNGLNGATRKFPSTTEMVVEILEEPHGKIYILNKWYKPGVPQIIHENMVKSYTPYPADNQ